MTLNSPARGPLTDYLITILEIEGFPVGDNSSPTVPYGWSGEPDAQDATFTPYMGITPLNAQQQRMQGFADSQSDWVMPYQIWYAGITRRQTEALADRIRDRLANAERDSIEMPTGNWKVQQVRVTVIGNNSRVSSAFPDYYSQTDTVEVWITKERS